MKKITLVLTMTLLVVVANAQSFVVNEVRQFMSKGEQNGFEVPLNGSKPEDAKANFEKLLKKYKAKIVAEKKNPTVMADNANIPAVSPNTVDIYYTVTPIEKGSKLTCFVDLGGAFVSSAAYSTQYTGMETLLKKFAKDEALKTIEEQLKTEEKIGKTLDGDFKDLTNKKADYIKEIEKAKALILQREQDILKNDADQKNKQDQITIQKTILETIKQKAASLKY